MSVSHGDWAAPSVQMGAMTAAEVAQMKRSHRKKVKALLKTNESLQQQLRQSKREGNDSYRVKLIKSLRNQTRHQDAIIEALKTFVRDRGATDDEISDAIDETLKQPKLARGPRPETLEKKIAILNRENKALRERLQKRKRKDPTHTGTLVSSTSSMSMHITDSKHETTTETKHSSRQDNHDDCKRPIGLNEKQRQQAADLYRDNAQMTLQVKDLSEDISVLCVQLQQKDKTIKEHQVMIQALQKDTRHLRLQKMQLDEAEARQVELTNELSGVRTELMRVITENEQVRQQHNVVSGLGLGLVSE